ncbi:hypothetical protein F8O06_00720 [Pseudoclavibacter sp. CFCC 14310]|uniref:hypothetical protein n=1 Tax=Pseudoclavibacter sp. CFCC 14310 TaxID=2615180 RepID=UPI001300ED7F|nr:hypothetical protein [Pseudoclavibacter sp. CFCC 14310]KAB1647138.1 hypothetical protein F8O06_00720 [Pseudoclavibacter sp. CFCC 14310]
MSEERGHFGLLEFAGGRFNTDGMPVAALQELRRFEVLLEEVAVELYKREHPRRERIARGFRASFDLRVADFRAGCVEAVLTRPQANDTKLDIAATDYFERSRNLVYDEIQSFAQTHEFTSTFPVQARSRLAVLGRGLRESENIALRSQDGSEWARLNSELRTLLAEVVEDSPTIKDTVVLGQITGVESSPHQVSVLLSDEQRIVRGSFKDPSLWADLHTLSGYKQRAPMVAISAKVQLTSTGEIEGLQDIFNAEKALPPDLAEQIESLAGLEPGWFDGHGEGISASVVDRVERLAEVISTSNHRNVSIFPRPDGGVQIEWRDAEFEIDVLSDGSEIAYALADERDADGERTFTSEESPERIISWLYGETDV